MILLRSDGSPVYMLAVVVDDHDMGVTHVIRGDDHLNNAARQMMIYNAMGWDVPVWAHIPLIHGPDGKKLSKRHGALGAQEYQAMGYPSAGMRNYLARLGWSHGDDEFFTDAQALDWFDLGGIGKSPARLHITSPGPVRRRTPTWYKIIPPKHKNYLPEQEITIAEILKKKNYATAHFGKWHLSNGGPGKHGFDVSDGNTGNGGPGNYKDPNPKDIFGVTKRANAFMDKCVKSNKPFYVQLSHFAVHNPHEALSKTIASCAKRNTGKYQHNVKYAAMTQDLDTSIGQVLEQIKKLGIANNTYVILTSDNGAGMRGSRNENHPLHGGKGSLLEGGIRVPLIIRGPGIKANSSLSENVIGYDLFPTICELAGVKTMPGSIEGISLVPLFSGRKNSFETRQLIFHNPHYGIGPGQKPQSALIQGNYKIIKDLETGKFMLFDLDKDLGERHDLSGSQPVLTADMQKKLSSYLKKVNAQQPVKNYHYDSNAYPGRWRPF